MPSRRRWRIAALVAGLLVAAMLVATLAWALTLRVELPAPMGPHAVGRARLDAQDGAHPIVATLYYPARVPPGASPARYVEGALAEALLKDGGPMRFLPDAWSRIATHVYADAPAAAGRYPVLLFSPGRDTPPEYYSALLSDLASHGYVVVALAHVGSTSVVELADGTLARGDDDPPLLDPGHEAARERRGDRWTRDMLAALDAVADHPRVGSAVDATRVGALGHSFGGAAAVEAASRDARILAALDMDGTLFGAAQREGVAKPIMLMEDDLPSNESLARAGLSPETMARSPDAVGRARLVENATVGYRLRLHGAEHGTFTTDTTLFEDAIPFLGGKGELDGPRAVALLRTYALAFFNRHVKGEGGDALDGPHPPEVSFASA